MSEQSEALAERIRTLLGPRPGVSETRMMGGVCFMLNGHMMFGPLKDGSLLVRVGKEGYDAALELPGAEPMTMTGRTMSGFVEVRIDGIETDEMLADWLARGEAYAAALPPKPPKDKTTPKAKAKGKSTSRA